MAGECGKAPMIRARPTNSAWEYPLCASGSAGSGVISRSNRLLTVSCSSREYPCQQKWSHMKRAPVRLLLADDHDVVRKGLRTMLEAREGWQVCGEASTGREAVELASQLHPDITVLDLEMTDLDGLEATRRIKKDQPGMEVLIFTIHD